MYYKLLVTLGVILLCIGFSNAENPCNNVNQLTVNCDYDYLGFCYPSLICQIGGSSAYDSITVNPPVSSTTQVYNTFYITMTKSGNYTFTATSGECVQSVVKNIQLMVIKITPPKCLQDTYTVSIDKSAFDPSADITFSLDSGYDLPTNQTTLMGKFYNQLNQLNVIWNGDTCVYNFPLVGSVSVVPVLQYTNPICTQSNGKIKVTNYQQYSSMKLEFDSASSNLTADSNGEFTNLQVPDGFSIRFKLYVKDKSCTDVYVQQGEFLARSPRIIATTTAVEGVCNASYAYLTVQVTDLPSLSTNNITINDEDYTIGEAILLPITSNPYSIRYLGNQCVTSISYKLFNPSSRPPAAFSVINSPPTCSVPSTVTLFDPINGDYDHLYITTSNNNYPLTMNAQHQVTQNVSESLFIQNNCSSILVPAQPTQPVYIPSTDDSSCGGNGTILVTNWEIFEVLELVLVDSSLPYVPPAHVNGLFKNVKVLQYNFNYRVKGCIGNNSLAVSDFYTSGAFYDNFVTYNFTVLEPRSCDSTNYYTVLQVTPIYKNILVSNISTIVQISNSGPNVTSIPFSNPFCSDQYINFDARSFGPYKSFTPPKITLVSRPQCTTSYGTLKIETILDYQSVIVDEILTIPKRTDGIYPYSPSIKAISITYSCASVSYDLSIFDGNNPIDTLYQLPMNFTLQSTDDCYSANGGLTVTEAEGYILNSTYLNRELSDNGVWNSVSQNNVFRYNHNYCGLGVVTVNIPTSTDKIIFKTDIEKIATCPPGEMDGDAVISLIVNYQNGSTAPISNVNIDGNGPFNPNTRQFTSVSAGSHTISFTMGDYCLFTKTIQVPARIVSPAFKANLIQYPISQVQKGIVELVPLYSDIFIKNIGFEMGAVSTDKRYLYYFGFPEESHGQIGFNVMYNVYCGDFYTINLTKPIPDINYTIKPVGCGSNQYTFETDQVSLNTFTILLTGYGQIQNTNPVIFSSTGDDSMVITDKLTGETFPYPFQVAQYNSHSYQINPTITYNNESCLASNDGAITITGVNFQNSMVSLIQTDYYYPFELVNNGNTMVFSNLPAGTYLVDIRPTNNSYCVYQQTIVIVNYNPSLDYSTKSLCLGHHNGSLSFSVDPPFFGLSVAVNGIPVRGSVFTTALDGLYYIQANVSYGKCFKTLGNTVSIQYTKGEPIRVDTSKCGSVAVISAASIRIYDSNGQVLSKDNSILSNFYDTYTGLPGGVYVAKTTESSLDCSLDTSFVVEGCPDESSTVSSSNTLLPSLLLLFIFVITLI